MDIVASCLDTSTFTGHIHYHSKLRDPRQFNSDPCMHCIPRNSVYPTSISLMQLPWTKFPQYFVIKLPSLSEDHSIYFQVPLPSLSIIHRPSFLLLLSPYHASCLLLLCIYFILCDLCLAPIFTIFPISYFPPCGSPNSDLLDGDLHRDSM